MSTADYKLFTPLTLGKDFVLKNRAVMSPMTRGRADPVTRGPIDSTAVYYEQRAGAGLIVAEASAISEQAYGWIGAPGIYTDVHADGWKKVTDAVHAKGVPRALETDEIPGIVEDYRKSAELAKRAGFDGVEIHGGNGYLVDLFLQSATNKRSDKYGGSIENRTRFLLEIVEALKTVWPSDRIGVRISPNGGIAGMGSEDNYDTFRYVLQQLSQHNLAYLAILDGFGFSYHDKDRLLTVFDAKTHFKGNVIATNSYTRDIAGGALRSML
ncbi:hypothetical protein Poli38472_001135 [Pythium oligandrum]|uniref:NADH:flavin oxidoreductase/NADH oxidase N-terminal domain-containing protein n=1 Tax=Pythium oligandrum TaxID=41045 RepID=A0A8K1CSY0_PYTOL|nr:hypothetical protein Poli38472_001135 [Pythium oligandrum]|eukprot:TMW68979.1 hypothetical protein Poli38472_001135 [Pythium oligandrum]